MQHSGAGVRTAAQGIAVRYNEAAIAATEQTRRSGSRNRTALRQVPGCCVHSGCIRRKHDAAKTTKKRGDEGGCHYRRSWR
jgi:hypothetical protein